MLSVLHYNKQKGSLQTPTTNACSGTVAKNSYCGASDQ